jgi:protein TonB
MSRASRLMAPGLALAVALVLTGCGGDEAQAPAAPPAAAPAPQAATTATAAPADAAAAPVAPAVPQLPVDELLKRARQALTDDRLVTPPGDNAIEYYLGVLAQEPSNMQATQALVDVFPLAAGAAERALAQRQVPEAERIVALLDRVDPKSYTVATLRTKLATAQAQVAREEQQAAAQATAQAAAAAAAAAQRAAEPAPAAPAPVAAAPAPATTPAPPPTEAPAPPAQPVETAPPAAPAGGETREARALRQVQPNYPVDAARKRQEGWVELEFTVGADGRVSDVSVIRAQPARVFDREAVRAMQQWTFEPALRGGQPVESRGRRRIQFQL